MPGSLKSHPLSTERTSARSARRRARRAAGSYCISHKLSSAHERAEVFMCCRRKIEMSPGAQSRDDTAVGGGHDERDHAKRGARANDIQNWPVCWLTQSM